MRQTLARCLLLPALLVPLGLAAQTALPQRNLLVEIREADLAQAAGAGGGWNVRSADAGAARERPPQQLRVLNGASGSLRLSVTRPVQVWQTLPGGMWPVPVPGTQWITAGQQITVHPRWPGGTAPVDVTLAVEASRFDPSVAPGSAQPPARTETRAETSLRVPLGEWVTVAASGASDAADRNVVSSGQAAPAAQRALQLRVSVAP